MSDDKFTDDILKILVEKGGYDHPMYYLYYLTSSPYKLKDDWNEVLGFALKNMNYPSNMIIKEYYDIKFLFTNCIEYYENKLKQVLIKLNIDSYFRYFYMLACEYYDVHTAIYCFLYEQKGKQYGSFCLNNIEFSVLDKGLLENVIFKGIREIDGYKEQLISRLGTDSYIVQYALYYTKYCNHIENEKIILKEDVEKIFSILNSIVSLCMAGQVISNNFGNLKQVIVIKNYLIETTELRNKVHRSVYDGFLEAQEAVISYKTEISFEMEKNFKLLYGFDLKDFVHFINSIDNLHLEIENKRMLGNLNEINLPQEISKKIIACFSQPIFQYSLKDIKYKFERNRFRLIYKPMPIMKTGEILLPSKTLLCHTYYRIQRDIYHNLIKELEVDNGEYHNKLTDELVERVYETLNNKNLKCEKNYYIKNCGSELKEREIDIICLKEDTLYLIECKDVDASFEPFGMFNDNKELKKFSKILHEKILAVDRQKRNYCNLFGSKICYIKGIIVYREYNGRISEGNDIQVFTEHQLMKFFGV